MANRYDIGDAVDLPVTFAAMSGLPADPDTITLRIKTPDGVTAAHVFGTDPDVTRSGTGAYVYTFICTQHGRHIYRWEGTGAVEVAEEGSFTVRTSQIVSG